MTPLEYKILGYKEEEYPGLTPYAPPLADTALLAGAAEEEATAAPSAVLDTSAPEFAAGLPEACLQVRLV